MSPLFSPSGLIYRYVLQSPDRSAQDLKILDDWVLNRRYRAIQGVADDSGLGGETMQYQVQIDPNRLMSYGVTVPQIVQQLANNNSNAGGGFYSQGGQFYYVRGLGLVRSLEDIGNIVIATHNGIPVSVRDVATVTTGSAPRLGQFGYMRQNDAVEGVILMRVGEQAQVVLKKVQEVTETLNKSVLPPDVKIVPYYDRTELIQETTKTVEGNLLRGMMLIVLVILGLFLFSVRTALIVAVTIPFALLFAFICLDWAHIPANLLSIGAIDFGMIVDGAVVMVENIFRELAARHGQKYDLIAVIRAAAKDVERPIFYAIAVIIAGYLPIYVLTGPSGRLFRPMADTMAFALVGALLCSLTLLPVLCAIFLRKHVKEPAVPIYERILRGYGRLLDISLRHRAATLVVCIAVFAASLLLVPFIGAEFMPHLDEGALWVRATMPYTISFDEASKLGPQVRNILLSFPQVTTVANELGRPDDGTDPIGFFNDEYFVGLKPYEDPAWGGAIKTKPQLIDAIQQKLSAFPGIIFNYTQPAEDAVDEAETGLKSSLAVKIFGSDLATLEARAEAVQRVISAVPGITNITLVRELGQPSLTIEPDRAKIAALRPERRRHQRAHRDGGRRRAGDAGDSGRAVVRSRRAAAGAVPAEHGRDQEYAGRDAGRPAPAAQSVCRHQDQQGRVVHLPRVELAVRRHSVQRGRTRPRERGRGRQGQSRCGRAPAGGIHLRLGRRVQGISGGARTDEADTAADDRRDSADSVRTLRQPEVPADHHVQRAGDRAGRRAAGAQADGHQLQRLVRIRVRRADGRRRSDQRHFVFIHQQTAHRGKGHQDRDARSVGPAPSADHDDGARRVPRPAARGHVDGHRQRFAEAVRHRDCGRPRVAARAVDLPGAGPVRTRRAR